MMMGGNNQMVSIKNKSSGEVGSSSAGGEEGGGLTLKKGPWTAAEDAALAEYVRTHGEGNWNAVQKNTGLARCGKSCRLRWANHLRPNLKKGAFSPEEETLIVELHAKLGNKWARMATQLPGRTDNEIKNFWNTRVKRRQRQGLSLYPPDIQPMHSESQRQHEQQRSQARVSTPTTSSGVPSFSFQTPTCVQGHQTTMLTPSPHHDMISGQSVLTQPLVYDYDPNCGATQPTVHSPSPASTPPPPPITSPSPRTPTHVSPLPSPRKPSFSTLSLFDSPTSNTCSSNYITSTCTTNTTPPPPTPDFFFFPRTSPPSLQNPLRYKRFRYDGNRSINNNHNIAVNAIASSCTNSTFTLPFSPLLKTRISNPHTPSSSLTPQQYNYSYSLDPITFLDPASASASRAFRSHYDSGQFISTPGFVHPLKTELPSNQLLSQEGNLEVTYDIKGNNYGSNDHNNHQQNLSMPVSGSGFLEDMLEESQALGGGNYDIMRRQNCLVGFSSSSEGLDSGLKAKQESVADEEMNSKEHEDYSKLLNVINPSSMPIPEWYNDSGEGSGSNGQSSNITDDNAGLNMHQIASLFSVDHIAPAEHDTTHTSASRSWDNLPGIC